MSIAADPDTRKYFELLEKETDKLYAIAESARKKGYDPISYVEIKRATNLAERTEAIIGPKGVAKRYMEIYLESKDRMGTIFKIFEEIILGKLGNIKDEEQRVAQAIRTALVLLTEGVVVAPIDGLPEIKLSKNLDGTRYVDLYFAGPIRAAGGTATVFPLILGDYARHLLGLARYKPTEQEIERYVEENKIYHQIASRQFKPTDDDIRHIIKNCPVCINGDGTDDEVAVYRDLPRIKTNRVRGGANLVISEGIGLKAAKLVKFAKKLNLDWSWLDRFVKVKDKGGKKELVPVKKYLSGAAAGRPIYAYPSQFGGFRVRYGRTRTTGLMGKAIHPVTMYLLEEFPAVGGQFKVERPGKAATITACDEIEAPIVLTKNKEVIQLKTKKIFDKLKDNIEKILFLGDMLVPYGDFRKSGHPLVPVGFCEEWWHAILEKKDPEFAKKIDYKNVNVYDAIEISQKYNIPLYPKYIAYYKRMDKESVIYVQNALKTAEIIKENNKVKEIRFNFDEKLQNIFINILLEYEKKDGKIVLKDIAPAFYLTFNPEKPLIGENVLEILSNIAGFEIKDKGGTFIGARMGRPEAAKPRKMDGSPQGLFPISDLGGNVRNINKAVDVANQESKGLIGTNEITKIEIGMFKCPKCGELTPNPYCYRCNIRTEKVMFCKNCGKMYFASEFKNKDAKCPVCGGVVLHYRRERFDLGKHYISALRRLNENPPAMVKGVKGLVAKEKIAEPIEKAILRAKHNIFVFKDGTVRADLIDINLTHFRPKELNLDIATLRKLGYTKDIYGNELTNENQMLRLFVQDIVVNNEIGDYFVRVANFIDDLLVKFYGLEPYYNVKKKEDLIGHLVLGLAPHTSAGVVGRIIGFTKARGLFAHPFYNTAKRRNTDGDQDGIILFLDALLNFSTAYLSSNRGGKMDAPLVATVLLNPTEIDDEAYEMELVSKYPLELYEAAERLEDPNLKEIPVVENVLDTEKQFNSLGFTHDTSQFDAGPVQTRYTQIKNMTEKIMLQIELQKKITAVDLKGALELVVNTHLLPDLIGNARAFSRQAFRCSRCNTRYRRLPLSGICRNCGSNSLILTISEGSVKKYLEIAKSIVFENDLSEYTKQRVRILEREINSIFNEEENHQKNIFDFI